MPATTTPPPLRADQVRNNHGTTLHKDSRIHLVDEMRAKYGGARFIDAETFVEQNPDVPLRPGFVIGYFLHD